MADGADGQEVGGEEYDDGDFPFMKADHPAYGRLQAAWKKQLGGRNDRVSLQLHEKNEELRKLTKHREEIGVTMYGAQDRLAKLQQELDQLHDKFATVQTKRLEEEETLKQVTQNFNRKKQDVDDAAKRLAKSQDELNQLNMTLRQVEEYNEQMKAEIAVNRRATYKAEDQLKQVEKAKLKQDVLIDTMNEDVKRMTEQKAVLDAQLSAQKTESEAANNTLREAGREMEAIEFEKKQLMQQWRSSLVGMQRRDEALQNVQQALQEQAEAELSVENEIRGLHATVRQELERQEQFTALKDRNDKEQQYLQTQMANIKRDREKLMDKFNMLKKTMETHEEETSKLKVGINEHTHGLEVVERNIQNAARDMTNLLSKIEDESSEQTTSERVAANSKKRMKKIQEEIAQKETETQNLQNEIARVTVDGLNTRAHNQLLRERQKELSDDLAAREKLIEQYEQEIRQRHHQIEKKQLHVDRLNRDYAEKKTKLENEAGDADVAGPQEAKLKHLRRNLQDMGKDCSEMQKAWIQKQTQLLSISAETDKLKGQINDQQNRRMVLEQKRIRVEGQLGAQKKEIKELEFAMKHLRFDMDRMNGAVVKHDSKSKELANSNQMMETEFVQKLKEVEGQCLEMERSVERVKDEKANASQEILEAERQVLLWERKITLEKEMQEALDPNVGQADAAAMKKEIHRMDLRLEQLKRKQEQMIMEMERAIHKRDDIALKYEPKAKKNKQASTSANLKRQVQSLKNNLRSCTQATSEAEQKITEREAELSQLQQTIERSAENYHQLERRVEQLRSAVQVSTVEKQRRLAAVLKVQRKGKRYDELSMGRGPPPSGNARALYAEQLTLRNKTVEIVKVLHDSYPQLERLWGEFYNWLEVPQD